MLRNALGGDTGAAAAAGSRSGRERSSTRPVATGSKRRSSSEDHAAGAEAAEPEAPAHKQPRSTSRAAAAAAGNRRQQKQQVEEPEGEVGAVADGPQQPQQGAAAGDSRPRRAAMGAGRAMLQKALGRVGTDLRGRPPSRRTDAAAREEPVATKRQDSSSRSSVFARLHVEGPAEPEGGREADAAAANGAGDASMAGAEEARPQQKRRSALDRLGIGGGAVAEASAPAVEADKVPSAEGKAARKPGKGVFARLETAKGLAPAEEAEEAEEELLQGLEQEIEEEETQREQEFRAKQGAGTAKTGKKAATPHSPAPADKGRVPPPPPPAAAAAAGSGLRAVKAPKQGGGSSTATAAGLGQAKVQPPQQLSAADKILGGRSHGSGGKGSEMLRLQQMLLEKEVELERLKQTNNEGELCARCEFHYKSLLINGFRYNLFLASGPYSPPWLSK